MSISRFTEDVARYYMLSHRKDVPNMERHSLLGTSKKRYLKDGLNTLEYKVIEKEFRDLYTWTLVWFEEKKRVES